MFEQLGKLTMVELSLDAAMAALVHWEGTEKAVTYVISLNRPFTLHLITIDSNRLPKSFFRWSNEERTAVDARIRLAAEGSSHPFRLYGLDRTISAQTFRAKAPTINGSCRMGLPSAIIAKLREDGHEVKLVLMSHPVERRPLKIFSGD